ncbi:SRPBCC family protein [Neobacillus rhizophilus]|uniref:SRPBCC family protein n=1 Tax=Neobacillus rhizophilus TaxID=2833579 RepID=A0A942U7T2_9BACI|nr:SRPBCC family protein [Neobacillus rhizophilus]MBS4214112.1 SRPBCC family protein [Neobacillus rhizophilus]
MENVNKNLGLSNNLRLKNVDVDRNAQVIVDLTTVIDAPLQTVWSLQTDINQWPSWQQDITQAQLFGPLAEGSTFKWVTHGLQIDSTISQVDPLRRIVWGGPALGIDGVHVWAFEFTPKGTVVNTTESWDGPPVEADPDGMKAQLTASLKAWLAALKKTAEAAN